MDKNGQRVACKTWNVYSPQRQNNLIFFWLPYSGLGKAVAGKKPRSAMQWDTLAFLPHPTDITDIAPPPPPPPPRPFASVRFYPLAWSSGSDQRRISGCGIRWLLAGPDSLPLWLCRVCAFVLLRCFSCSHTVLPKEHSLGIIFFSSLSSCKCCIFLQFYLHFTTDYTCMIVYVTNNKEPWTLNLISRRSWRGVNFRGRPGHLCEMVAVPSFLNVCTTFATVFWLISKALLIFL